MIDKVQSILNFHEIGDMIFCDYSGRLKYNTIIYSKSNKTAKINGGFYDDFIYKSLEESIPHYFGCAVENGIYSIIMSSEIPSFIEKNKSGNLKLDESQKEQFIDNITDESNPILFFYEIKNKAN